MRIVKVSAPEGKADEVIKVAFSTGIEKVSKQQVELHHRDSSVKLRDIVEIETSTPKAKNFIDALLKAPFYNRIDYSTSTRQRLSIFSSESLQEITKPIVEPTIDILEELWQFSHITVSFVGRFFIAGALLAFGLINRQILIIIAGLLFLPILPLLMSVSFRIRMRKWSLVKQGLAAFITATSLLILSRAFVAAFSDPPIKYDEFNSILTSSVISLAVGIAATLANLDDVGKRELIGLAATARLAILPVWYLLCFRFSGNNRARGNHSSRGNVFLNFSIIIIASLMVYIILEATEPFFNKPRDE